MASDKGLGYLLLQYNGQLETPMVFAIIIILAHCYYGYKSSGGPAGVGVAVGRAVRMVITTIVAIDLLLDLALYGTQVTVRIAG